MKQTILRTGISLLFSFLLALSLTVLAGAVALSCTVLRTDFVANKIDDELCGQAHAALLEELHALGEPSRIPNEVFDGVVSEEMVATELRAYVTTAWAGQPYVAEFSTVETDFYQAFEAYALTQSETLATETEEGLRTLARYCLEKYTAHTTIPFLYTVAGAVEMARKLLWIMIVVSLVLSIALSALLMKLQPFLHRGMRYEVYALTSVVLITVPVPGFLHITRPYARLNLTPLYVRDLFAAMVDDLLLALLVCGLAAAAMAVVALWIVRQLRSRLLANKGQKLLRPEDFESPPRHAR